MLYVGAHDTLLKNLMHLLNLLYNVHVEDFNMSWEKHTR